MKGEAIVSDVFLARGEEPVIDWVRLEAEMACFAGALGYKEDWRVVEVLKSDDLPPGSVRATIHFTVGQYEKPS